MEIRTLKYFLAVAREENITRAAQVLHITQPALSKQLKALENELGKKLFVRRSFSIKLTEEGLLMKNRAADLVNMADKIIDEFIGLDDITGGEIYLGLAESYQIRYLAREIFLLKKNYPNLHYHIISGDTGQVADKVDKGLLDFAVLAETPNFHKYNYLEFPDSDEWGLVVPLDDPLAKLDRIEFENLVGLPLFCSLQGWRNDIAKWCGGQTEKLSREGTFSLAYNASIFVKERLGYLLTFKFLIDVSEKSGLVFIPLYPKLETKLYLIWKKPSTFSPMAEKFLNQVEKSFTEKSLRFVE